MVEVHVKSRANRAVAALSEAIGDHVLLSPSPLINAESTVNCGSRRCNLVRYDSFNSLLRSKRQAYPLQAALAEWEALQQPAPPRDEFKALEISVLQCILSFVSESPRSLTPIAMTCRRLRWVVLQSCLPVRVDMVPDRISLEALGQPPILDSLVSYFDTHTRGQHVNHLALLNSRYAATLPWNVVVPVCDVASVLRLTASLPWLSTLDLRGVRWPSTSPLMPLFLSDLYLVAPGLTTLKMGVELLQTWSPGWWLRHPGLHTLVVGSRREPHCAVELPDDIFTLISSERRRWRIRLWCPLGEGSMTRLLSPTTSFPDLVELGVNMEGNTHIFEQVDSDAAGADVSAPDGRMKKSKRSLTTADEIEVQVFPSLTAFTVANVDERPMTAVELLGKLYVLAPKLKHFNLCNTARAPLTEKSKGRRHLANAAL